MLPAVGAATLAFAGDPVADATLSNLCRPELWDLDHINGWQVRWPEEFARLAIATQPQQAEALKRLHAAVSFLDRDRSNLQRGLSLHYSVPQPIVLRVIKEIDALSSESTEGSLFLKPVTTSADTRFGAAWEQAVADELLPAVSRYRRFLSERYLPRARQSLGLRELPNGARCYNAYLRRNTTLRYDFRQIYHIGLALVAQSDTELTALGKKDFGLSDRAAILARARADPRNRFASAADLMNFSQQMLTRSTRMSAPWFLELPHQRVTIEPLASYEADSGIPSHYESVSEDTEAAIFRISFSDWRNETRGAAAVTVVHETIPGHHMQIASARELGQASGFNSAYSEGWANYAERLAEELGIYPDDNAKIFRRSVLGRSLMVDPGIHAFGWSRDRAREFLAASGLDKESADDLIDRIIVQPGQLTSYEVGGMEIYRLREKAKKELGSRFDLRQYHERVLEHGVVSLSTLDTNIEAWIAQQKPERQ
jgi:uncharacterized protein (DUF885 family)